MGHVWNSMMTGTERLSGNRMRMFRTGVRHSPQPFRPFHTHKLYFQDNRCSIPDTGRDFSFLRLDQLWSPFSLLSNGTGGFFPRDKAAGA